MPHVLHIVADGAPGGGTTAVLGLCSDLVERGWRASLVSQVESYAVRQAGAAGIDAHALDFFVTRFDRKLPRRLSELVTRLRPDLIHVHGGRAGHAFCHSALRRIAPALVYTVHGYHFLKKPVHWRVLGCIAEHRIARRADRVVFVSDNDRSIAERFKILGGSKKSATIYNGIDASELDAIAPSEPTYDLVFVGRMHVQKNPLFVVEVMAELASENVRLLMVGGGELEAKVRAYAAERGVADRITFTGSVPRGEALKALRQAKLYLFPSLWEGLPIGPIEAMYYGLPIVASAIGGTDEVVSDGVTGVLLKQFDAAGYASAIRSLLTDPARYAAYASAARQRVEQLFLRRSCTAGYVSVYDHLLARRGRS
jgi:glycosyltransferase involved in cell wall biosynthesis